MLRTRLARFTTPRAIAWLLAGLVCALGLTVAFYSQRTSVSLTLLFFSLGLAVLAAWATYALYQAQHEIAQANRLLAENVDERATALQVANINLKMEVIERRAMETELLRYREHLEEIVAQRTAMLEKTNLHLLDEIAQRKKAERKLFEQKERAQITLASIGDAVVTTDAKGQVVYLNPVAEELIGKHNAEVKGQPIADMMHLLNEATRETVENPVLSCMRESAHAVANNASLLIRGDGNEIPISDSAAPISDREHNIIGAVMVFHDVTTERQLTQQLSYQATHDALTGLVNRQEFERRLTRVLQSAKTDHTEHALMFLDLDHFKQVNDTSGHAAGDELLRQIAALLKQAIRQRDSLARLGGDEFGLLLERCSMQLAESIAKDLLHHINAFVLDWSGIPHKVGMSIGMVAINQNSDSLSAVLSAADAACYESKRSGRNRYSIYPTS
ncbi:MAG: diguanylate cyclase, partial [Burkholderiales bacterium]|nr:diguanylate cyclase [Burkholderiales bacterium]